MLLLSLERLTRPLAIDPINRTARVGAGVKLSQLNAAAAENGVSSDLATPKGRVLA